MTRPTSSFVAVNPASRRQRRSADEPALAIRTYCRDGSADLYGFARAGVRTGLSVGAATAWVASEAVELHGSIRWLNAADTMLPAPIDAATGLSLADGVLLRSDPDAPTSIRRPVQALLGGTWTNARQISLLAEAWWDGTARSDAQWRDWQARNRQLTALAGSGAPAVAIATAQIRSPSGRPVWPGAATPRQ